MIYTSGDDQNSYIDLAEANAILLSCHASFYESTDGVLNIPQLGDADEPYLLEAARDLETLWSWQGQTSDPAQALAWPRRWVVKPGWEQPREPGWGAPWSTRAALQYKIDYLSAGVTAVPYLDATTVPQRIKEAQALIAALRKMGGNLVGDDQGDTQGLQLDLGFKIAYANACRKGGDVHKRLAALGLWIGEHILRTPGG